MGEGDLGYINSHQVLVMACSQDVLVTPKEQWPFMVLEKARRPRDEDSTRCMKPMDGVRPEGHGRVPTAAAVNTDLELTVKCRSTLT